ncbi:unnamed protein product [Paramecium octaurelia]|uniref:Uncharacterized protein n=1 Tax=Paramecium octaurelia TaxID=43137 RepID=A0A8S1U2E9_PAROT|nr:unnamed protein product [Paramecium octaurelia]
MVQYSLSTLSSQRLVIQSDYCQFQVTIITKGELNKQQTELNQKRIQIINIMKFY